jgi:hypothetical protein
MKAEPMMPKACSIPCTLQDFHEGFFGRHFHGASHRKCAAVRCIRPGRMAQAPSGAQGARLSDEGLGRDEVAKAQAREERLGERADIDHRRPVSSIDFSDGDGALAEGQLELVVVLDHHETALGAISSKARRRAVGMVTLVGQWWLGERPRPYRPASPPAAGPSSSTSTECT